MINKLKRKRLHPKGEAFFYSGGIKFFKYAPDFSLTLF